MRVVITLAWKYSSGNWILFENFKLRLNLSLITWKRISLQARVKKVNDKSDFVISLLKSRITSLEISLSKKDGITEFLPIQLILHSESKFETSSNSDTESKSNKKIITTTITRVFLPIIQLRRNMAKVHYKMWKSFL